MMRRRETAIRGIRRKPAAAAVASLRLFAALALSACCARADSRDGQRRNRHGDRADDHRSDRRLRASQFDPRPQGRTQLPVLRVLHRSGQLDRRPGRRLHPHRGGRSRAQQSRRNPRQPQGRHQILTSGSPSRANPNSSSTTRRGPTRASRRRTSTRRKPFRSAPPRKSGTSRRNSPAKSNGPATPKRPPTSIAASSTSPTKNSTRATRSRSSTYTHAPGPTR